MSSTSVRVRRPVNETFRAFFDRNCIVHYHRDDPLANKGTTLPAVTHECTHYRVNSSSSITAPSSSSTTATSNKTRAWSSPLVVGDTFVQHIDVCRAGVTTVVRRLGRFTAVHPDQAVEFTFDEHGRRPLSMSSSPSSSSHKVKVEFAQLDIDGAAGTLVTVAQQQLSGDALSSDDMMPYISQSSLNSFGHYTQNKLDTRIFYFSVDIAASCHDVHHHMVMHKPSYSEWTAAFSPSSSYDGEMVRKGKVRFVGGSPSTEPTTTTDATTTTTTSSSSSCGSGNNNNNNNSEQQNGMVSRVRELIPDEFVSFHHYGMVDAGVEITDPEEVKKRGWDFQLGGEDVGGLMCENYAYTAIDGTKKTRVEVWMDVTEQFACMMETTFPKALLLLTQLCEREVAIATASSQVA